MKARRWAAGTLFSGEIMAQSSARIATCTLLVISQPPVELPGSLLISEKSDPPQTSAEKHRADACPPITPTPGHPRSPSQARVGKHQVPDPVDPHSGGRQLRQPVGVVVDCSLRVVATSPPHAAKIWL